MTFAVIALVAVVMGMSAIAPMIPESFAHDAPEDIHAIGCPVLENHVGEKISAELYNFFCVHN